MDKRLVSVCLAVGHLVGVIQSRSFGGREKTDHGEGMSDGLDKKAQPRRHSNGTWPEPLRTFYAVFRTGAGGRNDFAGEAAALKYFQL